jgi:hypothetical protein
MKKKSKTGNTRFLNSRSSCGTRLLFLGWSARGYEIWDLLQSSLSLGTIVAEKSE